MQQTQEVAGAIATVTSDTFDELVGHATRPVVVEFMSYGCAHCRTIEPILQQTAALVADKETFLRVNVAVEADLAARYAIEGTPTLVMFSNGREIARVEGPHPSVASVLRAVTDPFER